MSEELWRQIEVIVNHAARLVLKIRPLQMHVLDVYRLLDWVPPRALSNYQDLNLLLSIKESGTPVGFSKMLDGLNEDIEEEEGRMVTRSVSQHAIRRTQDNDSRHTLRAQSFIPRMVRTFNALPIECRTMPEVRWMTREEKIALQKRKLRDHCQWAVLGIPGTWPENREDALLDREAEIRGLGINSSTSEDENETAP